MRCASVVLGLLAGTVSAASVNVTSDESLSLRGIGGSFNATISMSGSTLLVTMTNLELASSNRFITGLGFDVLGTQVAGRLVSTDPVAFTEFNGFAASGLSLDFGAGLNGTFDGALASQLGGGLFASSGRLAGARGGLGLVDGGSFSVNRGLAAGSTGTFAFDLSGAASLGLSQIINTQGRGLWVSFQGGAGADSVGSTVAGVSIPLPPAAWAGLGTLVGIVAVRSLRRRG